MRTTKFLFLLGPTCVGKGFTVNLTRRTLEHCPKLHVGFVLFGDIIRTLLDTDQDFKNTHGDLVKRGDLLDDDTAIGLFEQKLCEMERQGSFNLIIVDGFCRTTKQIGHATEHGYLQEKDMVFILDAEFETCLDRFVLRKGRDTHRTETEIDTFRKRFHLHADSIADLRALLRESDCQVWDIDANGSIPESVFPQFIGRLLPEIEEILSQKPADVIS